MISKKQLAYAAITIIISIILDQVTKLFMIGYLPNHIGYHVEILPFLDFVYAWNYGASFGILRDYYQYSNYILLTLNSFITLTLIVLLIKSNTTLNIFAYAFIIGGAVGNIIDRITHGAVFDFIYFHYNELYFPAFNIADTCITIGAIFYLYHHLLESKKI